MFPEYRALISRLKKESTRFAALFHEHFTGAGAEFTPC